MISDAPLPGALNMARDHALAMTIVPGVGALRIYRWARPTVSFGRNEPGLGLYDQERAAERGIAFVRRPTGGRAVFHDRELTYAVAVPLRWLGGVRETHRAVARGLVSALRGVGVPAELAVGAPQGGRSPHPGAGPCFASPVDGEIVVAGRKLVGSAQARLGGALLQHGSLLLGRGQELLDELGGGDSVGATSIALEEILEELPAWEDLTCAVAKGLAAELGGCWRLAGNAGPRVQELERSLLPRYASREWTWRR